MSHTEPTYEGEDCDVLPAYTCMIHTESGQILFETVESMEQFMGFMKQAGTEGTAYRATRKGKWTVHTKR